MSGAPRRLAFGAEGIPEEQASKILLAGSNDCHEGRYNTPDARTYVAVYQAELNFYTNVISQIPEQRGVDLIKLKFPWVLQKPYDTEIEYGETRIELSDLEVGQIKTILSALQKSQAVTNSEES